MKIKVSAPGKIILCGEHSVVHGKKAIAVALDNRTLLSIKSSSFNCIEYESKSLNIQEKFDLDELKNFNGELPHGRDNEVILFIQKFLDNRLVLSSHISALTSFLFLYLTLCEAEDRQLFALKVKITSDLPVGAGLGSSASYSVCLAAGMLIAFQIIEITAAQSLFNNTQIEEISQWGYRLEKIFHGKPSGIDNTICAYGHAVVLKSGQKCLPSKINKINVIVVNTKIPRDTKVLVKHVSDLLAKFPDVIEPILQSMDAVASQFEKSLTGTAINYEELKELVKINQHLLCAIGVSHKSLDHISRLSSKHNLSSKLTGAGGGGCAYILLPPDITDEKLHIVKDELEANGYNYIMSSVGGKGISLDFFER